MPDLAGRWECEFDIVMAWGSAALAAHALTEPVRKTEEARLSPQDAQVVRSLLKGYGAATDSARSDELARSILGFGPPAAKLLRAEIARSLDARLADYTKELGKCASQAYIQKLAGFTDEQVRQVQIDRFCITVYFDEFKNGAEKTSPMVAAEWRKPAWEESCQVGFRRMRAWLILPTDQVVQGPLIEKRQGLMKLCEHLALCDKSLPAEPAPPKKSPTGLEYPPHEPGECNLPSVNC